MPALRRERAPTRDRRAILAALRVPFEKAAREIVGVETESLAYRAEREGRIVLIAIADPARRIGGTRRPTTGELQHGIEENGGQETALREIRGACGDAVEKVGIDVHV